MITKATRRALRTKREIARGEREAAVEHEPEQTQAEIDAAGAVYLAARIAALTSEAG
jgi:hypothetical protein